MASIRRTLSPVPRAGIPLNGEVHSVASPLSKSSSCSQNYPSSNGFLSSLAASLDSQAFVLGVFSPRSSRPFEKSKPKGQVWRRALSHFFICFMLGVFIGATPFASMTLSTNLMSKHQDLSFEMISSVGFHQLHGSVSRNVTPLDGGKMQKNVTMESQVKEWGPTEGILLKTNMQNQSLIQEADLEFQKLLIIVTPTHAHPFQAYNLNRLAHTLKLVSPPLLWIVVEMTSQSAETTDMLRRTGIMYRHLVCEKNLTDVRDRSVHQRNVALFHIETHRLDGIIYFADEDNIYSSDLFEQMRHIRRFGTWSVAKITGNKMQAAIEGPVCNGTQVIGWHAIESSIRFQRFYAQISGFAFNSTILWDPKRWHRPTLEPIRQLDTGNDGFQVSTFIEQVVEDESQMEGLLQDCSRIMVWHRHHESVNAFYPHKWFKKNNLDVIASLT
ncbi:putative 1,4-beta-D-xylan synthase [Rosa chinensis]|uniref:Glycosyltransferases n=1 Tax=Rosa chinensis TaxID=74649 RepID=A0A2P6PZY7_ROSCH|nr:probable beta-1,4-xylosyltransferase IRX9H [Rosa chinensis]XP_024168170.1 probable beta-1,4-xylosyltransferase IRX9H [Rosa chinensis]PRQ27500.1 putative 1,4-beta-D-xylan synthase [Rosa chinensis]